MVDKHFAPASHGARTYPQQVFDVARRKSFPFVLFVVLTAGPALIIGAGLWYLAESLPACTITLDHRLTSPDGRFDLVTFSRNCGSTTGVNSQAAVIPQGDGLAEDATSFFSVGATADLAPRWDAYGNIELTVPAGAEIYRNDDTVAGMTVIYR